MVQIGIVGHFVTVAGRKFYVLGIATIELANLLVGHLTEDTDIHHVAARMMLLVPTSYSLVRVTGFLVLLSNMYRDVVQPSGRFS